MYTIEPAQVEQVCALTEHALGEVKRTKAESIKEIKDWHPSFAFIHSFHYTLEHYGEIPTYQRFKQLCKSDSFLHKTLTEPANIKVNEVILLGYSETEAKNAMKWRVGNAYYSFIRELYTISVLRNTGLDVRYHILADALLAIDAWCDDVVLSLYIINETYKAPSSGRKTPTEVLFSDANPQLKFENILMPKASTFGEVFLPSLTQITDAAKSIKMLKTQI